MRIEHINMTVSDVAASADFYRQVFGFKTRWEGVTGSGLRAVHMGTDDSYLSLFEAARPGSAPAGYGTVGFNHLGFVVEDLDALRETLAQMDVAVQVPEDYDPGRRLYFFDPDGMEIELVEY